MNDRMENIVNSLYGLKGCVNRPRENLDSIWIEEKVHILDILLFINLR